MDSDTKAALRRIESAIYAIAQAQDKLIGLLTEEADPEPEELDLEGNPTGSRERDQNEPL